MNRFFTTSAVGGLGLLVLAGCNSIFGMPDQMADVQNKIGQMNDGMSTVSQASHDQVLDGAIKAMFDSNNTMSLSAPAAMMPAAKIYADTATPDELIQYAFILMTDINQGSPDPSLQNADGTWPAGIVTQYDNHKSVERTVVTLIASLASQAKIAQVVSAQIDQHGLYEGATYSFLMFRYIGIESVILPESDFAKLNEADNLATVQDTYDYLQALDYLRSLPYLKKLSFNVIGMLDNSMNAPFALEQTDLDYPTTQYRSLRSFIEKLDANALSSEQGRRLRGAVERRLAAN